MATDTTERESTETAASRRTSAVHPPARRSLWRVSLGGILIFAAGMMVGFAPMRAWMTLKDEPEHVAIDAILFDVADTDNDKVRIAFSEAKSSDASQNFDPLQVLQSRIRSHRVFSRPTLTTNVDQTIELSFGSSFTTVNMLDGSVVFVPEAGTSMSFTTSVRPSGKLHLLYRTTYTSSRTDANGNERPIDKISVESAVATEPGVWRLVEIRKPTSEDFDKDATFGRSRWLILRMRPVDP